MKTFTKEDWVKIDAVMKTRLEQTAPNCRTGTKARWTPEELELRDNAIMSLLMTNSRYSTAQEIHNRWGISFSTAKRYVQEAVRHFAESFEDKEEELRRLFLERIEKIYLEAIQDKEKTTALKALSLAGKALGVYNEKKDVNLSGVMDITFEN